MKFLIFFFLIFLTIGVSAQSWKDSLVDAIKYYNNKEFGKAFQKYNNLLKVLPEDVDLSDEIAQAAYKAEQYKAAEEVYKNKLKEKNSKPKASSYHNLGNAQMKQENYKDAVDAYKNALRINPNDEETRYNLSEAIRRLKKQQNQQDQKQQDKENKDYKENKDQNKENEQKNKNEDKEEQKEEKNEGGSSISDNSVDKILDNLSKQESKTKQKNQEKKKSKGGSSTCKDW